MSGYVVVAPNAFKGTLSARAAAGAMAAAVRSCGLHAVCVPVADGGEGTADILASHFDGRLVFVSTVDALGRSIDAPVADLGQGRFAIDAASACGLARIHPSERNVLNASSLGLGLQIRKALDWGARQIIIGIGGTAFVDGGLGLAAALGVRFLDASGRQLHPRVSNLVRLSALDLSGVLHEAFSVQWTLLVDVDNPLLGPQGAAMVYGPQKGAGPMETVLLERGLGSLARAVSLVGKRSFAELTTEPGTGAGGGLAVVFQGLFGAVIEPGAEFLCRLLGLADSIVDACAVLTGEGRLDGQSLRGKAPVCVARLAAAAGKPVAAVVGSAVPGGSWDLFDLVEQASPHGPPERADRAADLLAAAAARALTGLRICRIGNGRPG